MSESSMDMRGTEGESPAIAHAGSTLETLLPESVVDFQPRHQTDQIEWQGLMPVTAWLVALLRPRRFVELGTHMGDSYCSFCQAISEQDVDCSAFAVDMWEGDDHTGPYGPAVYSGLKDYHDPLYSMFSRLLRMTFDDALPSFKAGSIDLLHIDGLHTYEAAKHDFETWLPKMSPRGVVILHDTSVLERGFGVHLLWEEIERDYLCFNLPYSNGLGIVIPNPEAAPAAIVRFARLSDSQRRPVVSVFKALGDSIVTRSKARWQANEVKRLEARVNELGWAINDLRERHRSELLDLLQSVVGDFPGLADRLGAIEGRLDRVDSRTAGGEAPGPEASCSGVDLPSGGVMQDPARGEA